MNSRKGFWGKGAKLDIPNCNQMVPKQVEFPDSSFFAIGFSHQMFTEETDGNYSSECISFTER